jgi:hypothetical protein
MNHAQVQKSVVSISPAAGVATGATHSAAIDCLGFDSASIDVSYRNIAHTSAPAVVTLLHSDTDGSYVTAAGFISGTDYTVAGVANTATVNVTRFDVSTKALRRYLQVNVTPSASGGVASNSTIVISARLGRGEIGPDTASEAGVNVWARG